MFLPHDFATVRLVVGAANESIMAHWFKGSGKRRSTEGSLAITTFQVLILSWRVDRVRNFPAANDNVKPNRVVLAA